MLEHTKRHGTIGSDGEVSLRITGPAKNREKLLRLLEELNFSAEPETADWRKVFSEYSNEKKPGICLAGSRHREGLTQKQLSELTGIPQRHISEMENGKRPIGKLNAQKFAKALNAPGYQLFL